jgi:TRAP-type C4-dicarboxylate transport system substrate-binding protein
VTPTQERYATTLEEFKTLSPEEQRAMIQQLEEAASKHRVLQKASENAALNHYLYSASLNKLATEMFRLLD